LTGRAVKDFVAGRALTFSDSSNLAIQHFKGDH